MHEAAKVSTSGAADDSSGQSDVSLGEFCHLRNDGAGGNFGEWANDDDELPCFLYNPTGRAEAPYLAEGGAHGHDAIRRRRRRRWHSLSNDAVTALAMTSGFVQCFDCSRGPRWINYLPRCVDDRADDQADNPTPRLAESTRSRGRQLARPCHAYGGGFGWVKDMDSGVAASTLPDDAVLTGGSIRERVFGCGYSSSEVRYERLGCLVRRRVTAPFGSSTHWLSRVTVSNFSSETKRVRLWEYWDVNPRYLAWGADASARTEAARTLRYDVQPHGDSGCASRGVSATEKRTLDSPPFLHKEHPHVPPDHQLTVFLVPFDVATSASVSGFDTDPDKFFGEGDRSSPATVRSSHCHQSRHVQGQRNHSSETVALNEDRPDPDLDDTYVGTKDHPCLVLQADATIEAGGCRSFTFAFGFVYGADPVPQREDKAGGATVFDPIVGRLFSRAEIAASAAEAIELQWAAAWKQCMPTIDLPLADAALARHLRREVMWHTYYTRTSSVYDAYFGENTLSQGFWYQFVSGNLSSARDNLQAAIPMVYVAPELAKGTLLSTLKQATPDGEIPYAIAGHGIREPVIWVPGDTDLFIMWLATEYFFVTRDFDLLETKVPYSRDHSIHVSVWTRARRMLVTSMVIALLALHTAGCFAARTAVWILSCGPWRSAGPIMRIMAACEAFIDTRSVSRFWLRLFLLFPNSLQKCEAIPPPQYETFAPLTATLTSEASVWHHLRTAFYHLRDVVGVHRVRKGLLRVRNGDWNDGIVGSVPLRDRSEFLAHGASCLTTAQACALLPRFEALAQKAGDSQCAKDVALFCAQLRDGLAETWSGTWYGRGADAAGTMFGSRSLFLEPQPWAILSGVADRDQTMSILQNIDQLLRRGSHLGARNVGPVAASACADSEDIGTCTAGSVWACLSHTVVWAAQHASIAQSLERGAELAWDELKRSLLANHAQTYPDNWVGVWSGPDSYNSNLSSSPGMTWDSESLKLWCSSFPIMNSNAHCSPLLSSLRLAGINVDAHGYSICPCVPPEMQRERWGSMVPPTAWTVSTTAIDVQIDCSTCWVQCLTASRDVLEFNFTLPWWFAERCRGLQTERTRWQSSLSNQAVTALSGDCELRCFSSGSITKLTATQDEFCVVRATVCIEIHPDARGVRVMDTTRNACILLSYDLC